MDAAYFCYLLLGAGTLFPWNAFITGADYYADRYPGKHTDRLITVCYLPANLVVLVAMVHWHYKIPARLRILFGFVAFTAATAAMPLIDMAPASGATLGLTLMLVVLCGAADGVAQGALFGEAASLQPKYTQALVQGTAVSGVAVSLLRIATKAALPPTPAGLHASANVYFLLAAAVCACCAAIHAAVLPQLKGVHVARLATLQPVSDVAESCQDDGTSGASLPKRRSFDVELSAADHSLAAGSSQQQQQHGLLHGKHLAAASREGAVLLDRQSNGAEGGAQLSAQSSYWAVLWEVQDLAGSLVLVYTVTLSIFPGVLAEDVASKHLGSWYPVLLIALFNAADAAGKWLPAVPALQLLDGSVIAGLALTRMLFIPAFHVAATRGAGAVVIALLTLLLGVSNGFLTAASMVAGPLRVSPSAASLCGNLMVLSLILGLCIGAACGFFWLL